MSKERCFLSKRRLLLLIAVLMVFLLSDLRSLVRIGLQQLESNTKYLTARLAAHRNIVVTWLLFCS